MALTPKLTESLLERGYSRRQISRIAMGAGAAIPFFHEFAMAQQAEQQTAPRRTPRRWRRARTRTVRSRSGPDYFQRKPDGALQRRAGSSLSKSRPWAGAIRRRATTSSSIRCSPAPKTCRRITSIAFPGSSIPLANSAAAFTSPTRAWVMGSPGYGSGAGRWIGRENS